LLMRMGTQSRMKIKLSSKQETKQYAKPIKKRNKSKIEKTNERQVNAQNITHNILESKKRGRCDMILYVIYNK